MKVPQHDKLEKIIINYYDLPPTMSYAEVKAVLQLTNEEMAQIFAISEAKLYKLYKEEVSLGLQEFDMYGLLHELYNEDIAVFGSIEGFMSFLRGSILKFDDQEVKPIELLSTKTGIEMLMGYMYRIAS